MPSKARPRVTIACATSLDGKIATAQRDPIDWTSRRDRARLHALRDGADAILIGAATLRAEDPPLLPTPERARAREKAGRRPLPVRAVVSRTLDLPLARALEPREGAPVHVFTVMDCPRAARERLTTRGIRVHVHEDEVDLARALAFLKEHEGVRSVLCEGGGVLNAALLQAGLVDELELTVVPVVIGGDLSPTLVDGIGFSRERLLRAKLVSHEATPEGEVFLRYRFRSR
ncbi:dihydrofolate reductase family protein [bacterium]|nr:dihydrofolate reductase family protein [bacterium]